MDNQLTLAVQQAGAMARLMVSVLLLITVACSGIGSAQEGSEDEVAAPPPAATTTHSVGNAPSQTPPAPLPQGWRRVPEVLVISARPADARLATVSDAVSFWNETLRALGSGFELGAVTLVSQPVPDQALVRLSQALLAFDPSNRAPYQDAYRAASQGLLTNDLVVMLADADFISFSAMVNLMDGRRHVIVGIKGEQYYPLGLPNVLQNVVAHELGHAIGLVHNADPTMLMCGRPAPCRPDAFMSLDPRYFPLTDEDKARLVQLYPPTWRPSQ